eukprot:2404499-Rhodomonas_salina.1
MGSGGGWARRVRDARGGQVEGQQVCLHSVGSWIPVSSGMEERMQSSAHNSAILAIADIVGASLSLKRLLFLLHGMEYAAP